MQRIMSKQCVNDATKKPQDYVIATGKQYTVKELLIYLQKNYKCHLFGKALNLEKSFSQQGNYRN